MSQEHVYEGTPDQLVKLLSELPKTRKYKMTVIPEDAGNRANEGANDYRVTKEGTVMPFPFKTGHQYSRRDVYRIIGIPEDTHGGNWDTGYARHGNDWFIFCNVGTAGRTGHDYANKWIGNRLEWYGKTNSRRNHPSIQSMTDVSGNTYLFWRADNGGPFTFAGIATAESIDDSIPVRINWSFKPAA